MTFLHISQRIQAILSKYNTVIYTNCIPLIKAIYNTFSIKNDDSTFITKLASLSFQVFYL